MSRVTGDRRWETGDAFCDVISKIFIAYNLAGEFVIFLRTLIANRKYRLAVAAMSARWGKKYLAVFRSMKNLADLVITGSACQVPVMGGTNLLQSEKFHAKRRIFLLPYRKHIWTLLLYRNS